MKPCSHPTSNRVLLAPSNWKEQAGPSYECADLPVTDLVYKDLQHVVSFWRPTEEELKTLNEGGSVSLWVVGDNMPAVMLSAEPDPEPTPIN